MIIRSLFSSMLMELGCKPCWLDLFEWSHWITPEDEKYRYDTFFYLIPLETSAKINASHDGLLFFLQ